LQNPGEPLPKQGAHKLPPRQNAGTNLTSTAFIFLPQGQILQPDKDLPEDITLGYFYFLFLN